MKTDSQLQHDVSAELEWEPSVHAVRTGVEVKDGVVKLVSAIQVMVEDGWVTLSGDVDRQYQRQAATDSVHHLMGVTGVSDQIRIEPPLSPVSAIAVKSGIEAALKRMSMVDARTISIAVHGSDVTLSGTVHNWDEYDTASKSAWGITGVHSVIDRMTLAN